MSRNICLVFVLLTSVALVTACAVKSDGDTESGTAPDKAQVLALIQDAPVLQDLIGQAEDRGCTVNLEDLVVDGRSFLFAVAAVGRCEGSSRDDVKFDALFGENGILIHARTRIGYGMAAEVYLAQDDGSILHGQLWDPEFENRVFGTAVSSSRAAQKAHGGPEIAGAKNAQAQPSCGQLWDTQVQSGTTDICACVGSAETCMRERSISPEGAAASLENFMKEKRNLQKPCELEWAKDGRWFRWSIPPIGPYARVCPSSYKYNTEEHRVDAAGLDAETTVSDQAETFLQQFEADYRSAGGLQSGDVADYFVTENGVYVLGYDVATGLPVLVTTDGASQLPGSAGARVACANLIDRRSYRGTGSGPHCTNSGVGVVSGSSCVIYSPKKSDSNENGIEGDPEDDCTWPYETFGGHGCLAGACLPVPNGCGDFQCLIKEVTDKCGNPPPCSQGTGYTQ